MQQTAVETLTAAIPRRWPEAPGEKARRYVGQFFDRVRMDTKILAKVVGNHGTYTVSLEAIEGSIDSACSCYIGRGGYCHHCQALALTFLEEADSFHVVKQKKRKKVRTVADLPGYLQSTTLESLLAQLKDRGISQKALAEGMGMNPRHLTAIKSSELRNRCFNELGATKLACLWVLEHCANKG